MRLFKHAFDRLRTALAALALGTLALAAQAGTTDIYYHNDLAGTPLAATDAAGNVLWRQGYKPYGERLEPKAPAEQLPWYTGKAHVEAAGLSYYGARWYDPGLGRFMGMDPVGFSEANVHSFNRYAYANNNPYKFVDPDGRTAIPLFSAAIRVAPHVARGAIALNRFGSFLGLAVYEALHQESIGSGDSDRAQAGDGQSSSANGGGTRPPDRDGPNTRIEDSTRGNSVRNLDADISRSSFERNLETSGFERSVSKDGRVANFEKGDMKYSVRESSKSRGPTADVSKSGELVQKIRLIGDP